MVGLLPNLRRFPDLKELEAQAADEEERYWLKALEEDPSVVGDLEGEVREDIALFQEEAKRRRRQSSL